MRTAAVGATFAALLHSSISILVTPGSSCEDLCGNVDDATTPADIDCNQNSYSTSAAGIVFQGCVTCELSSTFTAGNQTDLQWMLCRSTAHHLWPDGLASRCPQPVTRLTRSPDNVRYAVSFCLFGDPRNEQIGDSPCVTRQAGFLLPPGLHRSQG